MRKIVLKFKDGEMDEPSLTNHMIMLVSKLVHVEALFENGISWSSTQMGEDDGVRFKEINYSHPELWKEIVLWVTDEEYERICFRCSLLANLDIGYDMRGAIGCAVSGRENPLAYFCSEAVFSAVLSEWLPIDLNHKMHPDRLYDMATVVAEMLKVRSL